MILHYTTTALLKRSVVGAIFLLSACVSPAQHFDAVAHAYGFSVTRITTARFTHKVYRSIPANTPLKNQRLHIYLDGDGTPWEQEQWLSEDPTSRDPLILRLMQVDTVPSILVGRPCYQGISQVAGCEAKYWTSHRYAQEVVDSMVEAINSYLQGMSNTEIVLIGYSGGGALALLMAPKLTHLNAIITLAANLDTYAWSQVHGYPPLIDSLNPAESAPLKRDIKQYHFAGALDDNVPASIIQPVARKQLAYFRVVEGLGHHGCWECDWQNLLAQLDQ